MTRAHWQAQYLPNGGQILFMPLATVYSTSTAEARRILGSFDPYDQAAKLELTFDSAEAQMRLGLFGCDTATHERMLRGDPVTP